MARTRSRTTSGAISIVPKLTGDISQLPMTLAMVDGVVKGQFILGQNPVVGAVNSDLVERGLAKLDWLVVRDFAMTETANFWQKGRLVQRGELRPQDIGTEVFFLPAALAAREGRHRDQHQPPRAVARQGAASRRATAAPTCGSSTISASG